MDIGSIKIEDYDYTLPDEKIAKFPLGQRDMSKLLVYRNATISETIFANLSDNLNKNSLLVFNNTRVIHARLEFRRPTGARIEVLCLEPYLPADYAQMFQKKGECTWLCMVGNLKKWKSGILEMPVMTKEGIVTLSAAKLNNSGPSILVKFSWNNSVMFGELIEDAGIIPLPPYLNRPATSEDNTTYQTVYSKVDGSVAAPTAGLHFTSEVFDAIKKNSIEHAFLTLHVGAGTFKPVKADYIVDHEMHTEHFEVDRQVLEKIINRSGDLVAIGTTSVRTLESLYWLGIKIIENRAIEREDMKIDQWDLYKRHETTTGRVALESLNNWMKNNELVSLQSSTRILIVPGYRFRLVDAIITNFHQPKSTLLLLISAWVGQDWKRIYMHALENNFRFLSYGDSSVLFKSEDRKE